MSEPIMGRCPECFSNGAPLESLDRHKLLVDGIRCGPCYRIAMKEGRVPRPPRKPRERKPPRPRPKSAGWLQRRADEEALEGVIKDLDKGTHFLVDAARALGWPVEKARQVYSRLYDRGHRRGKVAGGNVLSLLSKGPHTFEELRDLTGMSDGGVYAALKVLGPKVTVTRMGRKRIYRID